MLSECLRYLKEWQWRNTSSDRTLRRKCGPPGSRWPTANMMPTEKLDRGRAFVIYWDMGEGRSLHGLTRELKAHHPEIAAARPTLLKLPLPASARADY